MARVLSIILPCKVKMDSKAGNKAKFQWFSLALTNSYGKIFLFLKHDFILAFQLTLCQSRTPQKLHYAIGRDHHCDFCLSAML